MQLFSRKLHKLCIKRLNRILYLLYTVFMALVNHSMFIEYILSHPYLYILLHMKMSYDKYTSMNLLIKNQTHRLEKKERNACKPEKVMRSSLSRGRKLWVMDDNKTTEADMRGKTLTVRLSPVLCVGFKSMWACTLCIVFKCSLQDLQRSLYGHVLHHPLDE